MDSNKKTAVYCRTIEEYNIVAKHYGRTHKEYFTEHLWNCIETDNPNKSHSFGTSFIHNDIPFNYWILTEMPKIGDKVIITKSDRSWSKPMDKYDGKIVIVTSTHEESRIRFDDCGDWSWNFLRGHFRIATPEEISNYENKNQPESIYVKIANNGVMYTTHGKAEEYGCTNYDYRGSLSNGTVCRVIATPYINNTCNGYVLEHANKHYLIEQSGTIPATKKEYDAQFKEKDSCLFVKGQWYKGDFNHYMKFSHLENRGDYNALYYTEKIYNGQYISVNDYWANNGMEKHALEYPLEKVMDEIQPFLPEGHEDKVVKVSSREPVYIAGRWYKMNDCWYAKCSKDSFDKENFEGNEQYTSKGFYYEEIFSTTLEVQKSIIELTKSTIDLNTPIELKNIIYGDVIDDIRPEPKYKVGDELESCEGGWQFSEIGLECQDATSHISSDKNIIKGKCTEVQWSNTHQIWWYRIGGYGNMFTESGVKLVEENKSTNLDKLIPKFSKGDKVKVCSSEEDISRDGFMDSYKNVEKIYGLANCSFTLTGEIEEKNGNIYYGYGDFGAWVKESCLSLIENGTVSKDSAMNPEYGDKITEYKGYKVGDAVIVKNEPKRWSSALNNNDPYCKKYPIVGVIKNIECRGNVMPYYAMDMGGYGWSLSDLIDTNNISKIEDLTEYAGLKVGDVLKEDDINEWREIGENYGFGGVWKKSSGIFYNDRHIKSFKLINGVVGFEVSGTANVYLRADGYFDFIKNKTIEENDSTEEANITIGEVQSPYNDSGISIPSDCPFKEGDSISCVIYEKIVEDGKIHFEDGNIYICQNLENGYSCKNKLGYLYSWCVYTKECSNYNFITQLNIGPVKYLRLKEETYYQKTLNLLKKQITII